MLKQAVKILAPLLSHGPLPKQPLFCLQNQAKLFSTSSQLCEMRRYVPGKTKGPSPSELRGKLIDDSDNIEENLGALTEAVKEEFQIFPDETTSEQLFNGIKFKDLPYVTIVCTFNHTKFYVNKADVDKSKTGVKKMASSMMSPGSAMIRVLSSRAAGPSLPIWSCRSSDLKPQSPLMTCLAPKPTSLSPFLGVRFCSTTKIEAPKSSPSSSNPATPSSLVAPATVSVEVVQGLPHLTVPLPSRNEPCIFVLKPVTHTIGDLVMMLKTEDHGIDRVIIRSIDGVRIASTTSIQTLMKSDFDLVINDFVYRVQPPPFEVGTGLSTLDDNEIKRMGDVRALVGELYEALHVEEYQAQQEQKLVRELEAMRDELAPLEDSRKILAEQAERRTQNLTWLGLGLMSVQFGILARLTWWEYSWDIMEPVTYFVTYGTAIACYAYFVLTRQDYLLPDVRDRQYLLNFHKRARKGEWDISKYNSLKEGICRAEVELSKLKDHTKLRPSNEALRKAAQEWEKSTGGLLSGTHVNIGSIRDLLKGKFSA